MACCIRSDAGRRGVPSAELRLAGVWAQHVLQLLLRIQNAEPAYVHGLSQVCWVAQNAVDTR
eukprot:9448680-Alexandrium_andersonii.AAC.1